ncbi:MAG TPA: murein L,D-transpeptidase catalytic domain family protein [Cytophagales bacterium]|nr:murein L,D-transpeptidase catalytic domain family protein [Cytophagales bacterium]
MIRNRFSKAILLTTLFLICFSFKAFNSNGSNSDNKEVKWNNYVSSIFSELTGSKAGLKYEVFEKGLIGYYNLKNQDKISDKNILSIVDFSMSANKKRLWIINLATKKILYNSLVAHGRNSGQAYAKSFSNKPESYMSSLGFYVTGDTYYGKHKLSLRLLGMDPDYNDNALDRAIVMHGAKYVSDSWIKKNGRLGRSLGCPAIPLEISNEVISLLANGTCLFLYYPNKNYENESALLQKSSIIEMFNNLESESIAGYHLK